MANEQGRKPSVGDIAGLGRYDRLLREIEVDVEDFVRNRRVHRAKQLSELSGQHFNQDEPPLYFTGDHDSELVLIHLNPKAPAASPAPRFEGELPFRSLHEYVELKRHFGAVTYGPAAPRTHRSPFDHKQIRFLRAFGVIPFMEERTREDRFRNLELVCDRKLQLELIPYTSPSFSTRGLTRALLAPHFERLMHVITARPRRYVIFCGSVFAPLLKAAVVAEHRFRLTRTDGVPERMTSRFAKLELHYGAEPITAGLAYSFARQGIPMAQYGDAVHKLYDLEAPDLKLGALV
jgi:hypothetical protein